MHEQRGIFGLPETEQEPGRHEGNITQLIAEFEGRLTEDQIRVAYDQVKSIFDDAPVRKFVPVLVNREVRGILEDRLMLGEMTESAEFESLRSE